jgi:NAD(P)H-hydrate epimerase
MQRAGAAAAAEIALRFPDRLASGVAVLAGPGNNGGDAWVVAAALAAAGVRVAVRGVEPRTDDARAERAHALESCGPFPEPAGEGLVVDGVLGTGSSGAPRGELASMVGEIRDARARGARVAALDVPSGVDATTGSAEGSVRADVTLTFGTMKRGLLVARAHAGTIAVLDIGLGRFARADDGAPLLCDATWAAGVVPPIVHDAHKGTRRKLAVLGGGPGMAGAAILAADAALRSGIGMVRVVVARESVPAVQAALPAALASEWPADDAALERALGAWADALLVGPGLGGGDASRALVERALGAFDGPVVLDADALNVFEGDVGSLARLLAGRPALVTPHPVEFGRLAGMPVTRVLAERFDVARELAATLDAAVLLKGVPTVVTARDGARLVSAAGTPALATAGSGDVLAGIAATLVAQTGDDAAGGACAAWAHGRAAGLASAARGGTRGTTLPDVLDALPDVWRDCARAAPSRYPVLAELPAIPA